MHPVLFSIGPIDVDSYYVIWGIALCMMVLWTRRRCVNQFDMSYNAATDVLFWTMVGVFVGASIGGYFDNWSRYAKDPITILYFWKSGLSSGPGFIGGGLFGMYKLHKLSISVDSFAEASSIPCAFMVSLGRIGCFMAGCCRGIATNSTCAVVFPYSHRAVYPSQLFESAACFIIGIILILAEKRLKRKSIETKNGAVLFPLFLVLYGSYRLIFDFIRDGDRIFGLRVGQYTGAVALCVGLAWLLRSIRRHKTAGSKAI